MSNEKTPQQIVDDLGFLKAQIAELQDQEDVLKAKLAASGLRYVDGDFYSASITTRETTRLDNKKVKGLLTPAQIIACSYTTTSLVVSVGAPTRNRKRNAN